MPSGRETPADAGGKPMLYRKVKEFVNTRRQPLIAPPGRLPPFGEMLGVLKMPFGFDRISRCRRSPLQSEVPLEALPQIDGRIGAAPCRRTRL